MESSYEMIEKKQFVASTKSLTKIREALYRNDYDAFEELVKAVDQKDLDYFYQHPVNKTCLELAICETGKENFLQLLLNRGVNINKMNEIDDLAPIHLAIKNGNLLAFAQLLENETIEIDKTMKGLNTPLLLAIKKINNDQKNLEAHEKMIELLLKKRCDVNAFDSNGLTPVLLASKKGLEKVVKLILEYGKNKVDLDIFKDERGKSARQLIEEKFPKLVSLCEKQNSGELVDTYKLFVHIFKENEEKFKSDFSYHLSKNEHFRVFKSEIMLQLATEKGLENIVEVLLNSRANPNINRPIAIACRNGFVNILEKYIHHESVSLEAVNGYSLLQITINGMKTHDLKDSKGRNHRICLEKLLETNKIDVNYRDMKKNTALHYAVRNADDITVLMLLNNGAFIGIKNEYGMIPLGDIKAETLEAHLDNCIKIEKATTDFQKQEIHIKFCSIVYSNKQDTNKDTIADQDPENALKKELPIIDNKTEINESDAFLYMARNKNLKHLLKHPVIATILSLKRQRINIIVSTNIVFYILLCLCLVLYIFIDSGVNKKEPFRIGTIIGVGFLTLREIFQILVTQEKYFQSIQNWTEIGLVCVIFCISFCDFAKESTKQQICAVAILLLSVELIFLLSFIPTFSLYMVMLMRVTKHYIQLLIWYCVVIIAFGLCFSRLFRTIPEESSTVKNCTEKNFTEKNCTEKNFFQDWPNSIFKTIVMVTGEFDISSIDFDSTQVTSHILFIIFLFLVPIVLSNLLNAIAVNDIQEIRAKAEIESQILLLGTISYLENLFRAKSIIYKLFFVKHLAKRINLFPNFIPQYKIVIMPHNNKIKIPGNASTTDMCACNIWNYCKRYQCYSLDDDIIENAKNIHSKNNYDVTKYVKENNVRLQNLENKLNSFIMQSEKLQK